MDRHHPHRTGRTVCHQLPEQCLAALLHRMVLRIPALPCGEVHREQVACQGEGIVHHHRHAACHRRYRRRHLADYPSDDRPVGQVGRGADKMVASDHPHQQPDRRHQGMAPGQPGADREILEKQGFLGCCEDHHAEGILCGGTNRQHPHQHRGIDDYLIIYVLHPARLRDADSQLGAHLPEEEPPVLAVRAW